MFSKTINTLPFVFLFFSQQVFAQDDLVLDTDDKKYSYAVGNAIGHQLVQQFSNQNNLQLDVLLEGVIAVVKKQKVLLSDQEGSEIIQQKQQQMLAEAAEAANINAEKGKEYLETNKAKEGIVTTASGLQYEVLESGEEGQVSPTVTDTVVVHYEGTLTDGTVFDSSYARGESVSFPLGSVISGWQEVLQLMKAGDKWAVTLPSDLAYGEKGNGRTIGPNEMLLFVIELLEVKTSAN